MSTYDVELWDDDGRVRVSMTVEATSSQAARYLAEAQAGVITDNAKVSPR